MDKFSVDARLAFSNFKSSFDKVIENYSVYEDLKKNKNPQDLKRLKILSDSIWESNKKAQIFWSFIQGDGGIWDRTFSRLSGTVALAKNYMEVSQKKARFIDEFITKLLDKVEVDLKNKNAPTPGTPTVSSDAAKASKEYADIISVIPQYKQKVSFLQIPDAVALNKWLDGVLNKATENKTKFDGLHPEVKSDPVILAKVNKNLDAIKSRLNDFKADVLA